MTPEQAAAYVMANTAAALIELEAMKAQDRAWAALGLMGYSDLDYKALIEKYGIHHNAVLTTFQGAVA